MDKQAKLALYNTVKAVEHFSTELLEKSPFKKSQRFETIPAEEPLKVKVVDQARTINWKPFNGIDNSEAMGSSISFEPS